MEKNSDINSQGKQIFNVIKHLESREIMQRIMKIKIAVITKEEEKKNYRKQKPDRRVEMSNKTRQKKKKHANDEAERLQKMRPSQKK